MPINIYLFNNKRLLSKKELRIALNPKKLDIFVQHVKVHFQNRAYKKSLKIDLVKYIISHKFGFFTIIKMQRVHFMYKEKSV